MNNQKVKQIKFITPILRFTTAFMILSILLSSAFACKPKDVPLVEFEGNIFAEDNIPTNDVEYSTEVKGWIAECNDRETSTISTYVLCYKEKLLSGNYRFHYLIYRRSLEKKAELAVKTLKNDKTEVIELNYFFVNGSVTPDVLTYVCYESEKKPTLDIIATDSSSNSEYCGYVETTAYEPFGLTVNFGASNGADTSE